ncbi:MAG TPA: YHS domain-containing protein [Methyloceanibacter sp.]|jgi:YHS domain-containing protein
MAEFAHDMQITATDPVCGMDLLVEKVAAHEDYRGWAYFFCSATCRDAFRAAPDQYTQDTMPQPAAIFNHGD